VTGTETFQEVCDRAADAAGQNPFVTVTEAGHAVPLTDDEGRAKYHAFAGYIENVQWSPGAFADSTVEDLVAGAESNADSDWTAYL
jgi:hypothetical protein